jgi:hypothetical protein
MADAAARGLAAGGRDIPVRRRRAMMSQPTCPDAFCFAMPVLPGKAEDVRKFWRETAARWAVDVQPHVADVGLRRLVACLQHTPIGDGLVQFVEAAGGAQAWVQRTSAVSTSYTRWMEQALRDFSGVDWTRPDSAPSLEPLCDWTDAASAGAAAAPDEQAFVMPVLPGKADVCRAYWAEATGPRAAEMTEHSRRVGLVRLVADLQQTPMGDLVVQYVATRHGLDGLLERAAASDLAVSRWIEQQFQAFSGVDWRSPQSKPSLELLFRWSPS